MKTSRLLAIVFYTVLFVSCNPLDLPWESKPVTEQPPFYNTIWTSTQPNNLPTLTVVKFKDKNLADKVILEATNNTWHLRGSDHYQLYFRADVKPGAAPFFELDNDYFILDWRWEDFFMYEPTTRFADMNWSEIKSWKQTWQTEQLTFLTEYGVSQFAERYCFTYEWLDWCTGKREVLVNPYLELPVNLCWYPNIGVPTDSLTLHERNIQKKSIIEEEKRFQEYKEYLNNLINTTGLQSINQQKKYEKTFICCGFCPFNKLFS